MLDQPAESAFSLDRGSSRSAQPRGSDLHLSLLRVGSLIIGTHRELCLIKNISAGGMLVRTYSPVEPGTSLLVELKEGEPLRGAVTWEEDDCIGVAFECPIDVLGLISSRTEGPPQRPPRVAVNCTAWIRDGAAVSRARTVDISQGGLRVASRDDLRIGAAVVVRLNGLAPIPGVLCWKDGDNYGIRFNGSVALPTLVGWIRDRQEQL